MISRLRGRQGKLEGWKQGGDGIDSISAKIVQVRRRVPAIDINSQAPLIRGYIPRILNLSQGNSTQKKRGEGDDDEERRREDAEEFTKTFRRRKDNVACTDLPTFQASSFQLKRG